MMISYIGVLLTIVSFIKCQQNQSNKIIKIDNFHLHEYNINNNWNYLRNKYTEKQIQQLHIKNSIISQEGLKKLFSQYNLNYLKILNIGLGNTIHHNAIKLLLSQQFIYNSLEVLILDSCNIQCQDFQVLRSQQSKIIKLSLKQNYISFKGFQYISRLKVNLNSLILEGNSLIHQSSINSLIKLNLRNIKQLNLGRTSISSQNLLKIFNQINVQYLVNLTMSKNVFPAQFYDKFTKLSFNSLQFINMYGLIIGDDYARYFQRFKLPSLKYLSLHQNQFSSETLKIILTKENYPKLQKLDLNLNFVNHTILKHLREQNFTFTLLKLRILTMDIDALKQMALMDMSKLQYLDMSHFTTTPENVKNFFKKANLTSLKQLHIQKLINAGPILQSVMNAKLPNLQVLVLPQIGPIDRKDLKDRVNAFPKLREATLKIFESDYILQRTIIQRIHKLAPKLQKFRFSVEQSGYLLQNLLNRSIKIDVYGPLEINLMGYVSNIVDQQSQDLITIRLQPNKTTKIINLMLKLLVTQMQGFMFQTGRIDDQFSKLSNFRKNIHGIMDGFLNNFDYSELAFLHDTEQYYFLRWYTSNNKNCKFLNLTNIVANNATDQNMKILSKCQTPNLMQIQIDFQQKYWSQENDKYLTDQQKKQRKKARQEKKKNQTSISLGNYPYLKGLFPTGITKQALLSYIKENRLQYLVNLKCQGLRLFPNDIEEIFKQLPKIERIRGLQLGLNFFNKNLTFLALKGKQLKLQSLDLQANLLNQNVFQQLCFANFQFIKTLSLSKIGVKDKQMIQLIQCLSKKYDVLFPKLQGVDFSQNYLQTQGISKFMSLDLPLIEHIDFSGNKDSQFFNSVFRYKASRRLLGFSSIQNYFSGIDKDVDKTHTKRVQTLILQSKSMRSTDIQQLSKFEFDSLRRFIASLQKITDCQSLQYIRNIIQKTFVLELALGQAQGIYTSCLSNKQSKHVLPSNVLLASDTRYGQLKKFVEFFFNPSQIITTMFLKYTYISDEKVKFIADNCNLQKVQIITLQNNDLSGSSIKYLLDTQYSQLKVLIIKGDERVTGQALSLMNNFKYSSLLQITFDDTSIGDEGIKYLIRNQFPKLIVLGLKNTDITREGIRMLSDLKAPNLAMIDLSCNQLSAADIASLDTDKFPSLKAISVYPRLSDKQQQMLIIKFNRKFLKGDPNDVRVMVQTDIWYEQGQQLQQLLKN